MKKLAEQKPTSALTTAAEAIGSTLGQIAVKTGLTKSSTKPASPVVKKRAPPWKKPNTASRPGRASAKKAAVVPKATRKNTTKAQ